MQRGRGPALRFRVFGTPVRIGLTFPLMVVALPLIFGGHFGRDPWMLTAWLVLVTVSVLVHEAGHVAALRACGFHPGVSLNAFGGLTSTDERGRISPWQSIGVSLAGPAAAILLGITINSALIPIHGRQIVWFSAASWFVNVWWSLFNLLPIVPLDGGHITSELVEMASRRRGAAIGWLIAATAAICAAAWWFAGREHPYIVFSVLVLMIVTNSTAFAFTARERRQQDIRIAHERLLDGDEDRGLEPLLAVIWSDHGWLVSSEVYTTVAWALLYRQRFDELAALELARVHPDHRPLIDAAVRWYQGDLTSAMGLITESLATGSTDIPDNYFEYTFRRFGELERLERYVASLPPAAAAVVGERLTGRVEAALV